MEFQFGGDLEYTDEVTLAKALEGRHELWQKYYKKIKMEKIRENERKNEKTRVKIKKLMITLIE